MLRNDVKTTVDVMKFYVLRINVIPTLRYSTKIVELCRPQCFSTPKFYLTILNLYYFS